MGKMDALLVLASNSHKFPSEDDHLFERDKLFLSERVKLPEQDKKKADRKKSLIMMEATNQAARE